jgi:hypothetical protein
MGCRGARSPRVALPQAHKTLDFFLLARKYSTFPRYSGRARRLRVGSPRHSTRWRPGTAPRAPLCWACSAVVLSPKARPFWVRGSHRGAGGTLDKFKAAREGRLAPHRGLPKILGGNLVPAAVADRRISLQPYAPGGSSWLVGNLGSLTDRHSVLQGWMPDPQRGHPARSRGALRRRAGVASVSVLRRGV